MPLLPDYENMQMPEKISWQRKKQQQERLDNIIKLRQLAQQIQPGQAKAKLWEDLLNPG